MGALRHQVVAEEDRERLVADVVACDPHRVTEPAGLPLAHIVDLRELGDGTHLVPLDLASRLLQVELQLERPIEVVFEGALAPARDDQDVADARPHSLLDHVLDRRLVDERQHLLGLSLRGRQKSSAEPRRRNHRLAHHRGHDRGGSLSTRTCRLLITTETPHADL